MCVAFLNFILRNFFFFLEPFTSPGILSYETQFGKFGVKRCFLRHNKANAASIIYIEGARRAIETTYVVFIFFMTI